MKLFIIGNGFDLAHNLQTSYRCFKRWLQSNLLYCGGHERSQSFDIPDIATANHGEEVIAHEEETKRFWLNLLNACPAMDADWCNFEEALYYLRLEEPFEEDTFFVDESARDKEGDINPYILSEGYCSSAEKLRINVEYLSQLFSQWVHQISVDAEPKSSLQELMEKDDIFLSFNYTETLEKIYGVESERVCHIHGLRTACDKLIIGHGSWKPRDFSSVPTEAALIMEKIIKNLRKPTQDIIKQHDDFWIKISMIDSIYSYGFSYGDIDLPYIEHICQLLGENASWYLHTHDDGNRNDKNRSKILNCGFKGKFASFS